VTKGTKQKPDLEWSVVATLAWFSVLGRALTLKELSDSLLKNSASEADVRRVVGELGPKVRRHGDFYSINGTEVRYPDGESERWFRYKWWRVKLALNILTWVPYLRMMAVTNTVADRTADKDSDIDVFIIIEDGRLFLSRTIITALLQLTGLRRHGKHVANRICLSFFVTTKALDLQPIAFPPYDIYLAYWIHQLTPVLDAKDTAAHFFKANQWVTKYIPAGRAPGGSVRHPGIIAKVTERLLNTFLGTWIETKLADWQLSRVKQKAPRGNARDPEKADVEVIANRQMLKFHEKERRRLYREQWERQMRDLGYNPELILS
jgi:hypothetical protein